MIDIPFEEGDAVRLKTGGRNMTVDRFDDTTGECVCCWREGEEHRTGSFPPLKLQAVMATKAE